MAVRGTGFTDIGQYLSANAGTLANERAGLAGTVNDELNKATASADQVAGKAKPQTDYTSIPGYGDALQQQNEAEADAANLGSAGGLQDLLQRKGDNAAQGNFDSQLLVGNPDLGTVQKRGSNLGDYLDQQGQSVFNQPIPPTPGQPTPLPPDKDPNKPPGESGTPDPYNPVPVKKPGDNR